VIGKYYYLLQTHHQAMLHAVVRELMLSIAMR